jgi:hypothetical protein
VGRERFDEFLRTYFDTFAFQSMDTRRFVDYLKTNLLGGSEEKAKELMIDAWIYGPGVPPNEPQIRSAALVKVDEALAAFQQGTPASQLDTKGWTTHHWLHFLRHLPKPLDTRKMAELDEAFGFTTSGNSEILSAWFQLAIASEYERAYGSLERFLTSIGRRKFLEPLYKELVKTPEGTEMALRIYKKARPGYHAVSRQTVDEILDWRG